MIGFYVALTMLASAGARYVYRLGYRRCDRCNCRAEALRQFDHFGRNYLCRDCHPSAPPGRITDNRDLRPDPSIIQTGVRKSDD